ncbi:hypothetical protein BS47DRAFT_1365420 [Hydnum rufescens UP504]|uniref:Uncharacterized protein n=1 Tax=Hydnum rufescens UP504 TaxID=1448309 RepID=A0A9P6ANP8_9AGAM|nr:hypothetical protein BS47DRAFT_1365420 [Hydnum rufescens UP504]
MGYFLVSISPSFLGLYKNCWPTLRSSRAQIDGFAAFKKHVIIRDKYSFYDFVFRHPDVVSSQLLQVKQALFPHTAASYTAAGRAVGSRALNTYESLLARAVSLVVLVHPDQRSAPPPMYESLARPSWRFERRYYPMERRRARPEEITSWRDGLSRRRRSIILYPIAVGGLLCVDQCGKKQTCFGHVFFSIFRLAFGGIDRISGSLRRKESYFGGRLTSKCNDEDSDFTKKVARDVAGRVSVAVNDAGRWQAISESAIADMLVMGKFMRGVATIPTALGNIGDRCYLRNSHSFIPSTWGSTCPPCPTPLWVLKALTSSLNLPTFLNNPKSSWAQSYQQSPALGAVVNGIANFIMGIVSGIAYEPLEPLDDDGDQGGTSNRRTRSSRRRPSPPLSVFERWTLPVLPLPYGAVKYDSFRLKCYEFAVVS